MSQPIKLVGITFNDPLLLQTALTHRSYLNEHPEQQIEDNERLEFLGDAVLDFIVGEWLFQRFPGMREGSLTRLRAGLVRNDTLATFAISLGIGAALLLGKGEEEYGGRERSSNLGSAFEAVIGALYIDQGLSAVQTFVIPYFMPVLDLMLREQTDKDSKSRFQEWAQATLNFTPQYRIVDITGPEHAREFTIEVVVAETVYGIGQGRSKALAAQAAASQALDALRTKGLLP